MPFDAEEAAKKLKAKLEDLNRTAPGTAMALQSAHFYSDALVAVSQANGCRLEQVARSMAMVGLSLGEVTDMAMKYMENPDARMRYHVGVYEMLALTEQLVTQALEENCGCQGSTQPAPLIGDMMRT